MARSQSSTADVLRSQETEERICSKARFRGISERLGCGNATSDAVIGDMPSLQSLGVLRGSSSKLGLPGNGSATERYISFFVVHDDSCCM